MADTTNKLSVSLIKQEFTDFKDIVEEGAVAQELGEGRVFYAERSHVRPPGWIKGFFGNALDDRFYLQTANARGILLVKVSHNNAERILALSFGFGRFLLREDVIEERFGLKLVLNSVKKGSLRSIDKTSLGSTPKQSREQMSRGSEASEFGIDIEQDLVSSVTGKSKFTDLGKTISGKDSFSTSVKINIDDVEEFLIMCLNHYECDDYKVDFEWIDQIKDIRETVITEALNNQLVAAVSAQNLEKIWMSPPTVVDWVDIKGFRYGKAVTGDLHDDLEVETFLLSLGENEEVSLDLLKRKIIYAISAQTDRHLDHWSAFKCLYAEILHNNRNYILNNGKWYEINADFAQKVIDDFAQIPESPIPLPDYDADSEGDYNDNLPNHLPDTCVMDRKMIAHGGGHSSIEFCDLFTADGGLVHVKRYSGSAQLSHLFNQGVVSGELFMQDPDFRQKVNEKLDDAHKLDDALQRPDPSNYEIVFAIISKSSDPLDIPFFSKVTLRNAKRRLEGYGYRVSKKKVLNLRVA